MATAVETLIVGAGQSGLAVSALLTAAGCEHVVVERGAVGERWRSERWDSLRLLTPNWLSRLPGWSYAGNDADGFMSAREVAAHLRAYSLSFQAPILPGTAVLDVTEDRHGGYLVRTNRGDWSARHVVAATGPHALPVLPDGIEPSGLHVIPSTRYRRPDALPPGAVLVVGASASGAQIADELAAAGRRVFLAVGRHTRLPRTYRGMDVFWWLDRLGSLSRTIDQVPDPEAARGEASLQLAGSDGAATRTVDLCSLHARGVRLFGRLVALGDREARFDGSLARTAFTADAAMTRLLDRIDAHADATGLTREVLPPQRPPTLDPPSSAEKLDLRAAGVSSVVIAAGLRPDYSWLSVPVIGRDGLMAQRRGVTASPGLYVVGQQFQHRRDSTLLDGARHNAGDVVAHLRARTVPSAR